MAPALRSHTGGFRGWLVEQQDRPDDVGDIARTVAADCCIGSRRSPRSVVAHLWSRHAPSDELALGFTRALREWQQ
jgi:hypothetical protein